MTPEFPAGTYAYFTCITSNGTPQYPYNVGRAYYGNPTGSTVNEINESVTVYAEGGPGKTLEFTRVDPQEDDLVLVYSSIEGGMYNIYCTSDLTSSNWTHIATNINSVTESRTYVVSNALQGSTGQFHRVALTNVTAFDDTGFDYDLSGAVPTDPGVYPDSGSRGTMINLTIIHDSGGPPLPPLERIPTVFVGALAATDVARPQAATITCTLTIPAAAATGSQTVSVVFPGPTFNFPDGFTIL